MSVQAVFDVVVWCVVALGCATLLVVLFGFIAYVIAYCRIRGEIAAVSDSSAQ
jgi:hypothetical protein